MYTNTKPETKQIKVPEGQAPQSYFTIPMVYNAIKDGKEYPEAFLLEGCAMKSTFGLVSKPKPNNTTGAMDTSIMCSYSETNEEESAFLDVIQAIFDKTAQNLFAVRGLVKMTFFNATMAEATGLKNQVYRARDPLTSEIIPGRNASIYWKFFDRGQGGKTLITDLNGKAIPWEVLYGNEVTFVPVIRFKHVYVGTKASIQAEIESAFVVDIKAKNSETTQMDSIEEYKRMHPDVGNMVSQQLAMLSKKPIAETPPMDIDIHNIPSSDANDGDDGTNSPTFSHVTQPPSVKNPILPNLDVKNYTAKAPNRT